MKFGIIGCGNMAGSILTQMLAKGFVQPEEVMVCDFFEKRREELKKSYGVGVTDDNLLVVKDADILLLGTKPQDYREVIEQIRQELNQQTLVLTIAVGMTIHWIEECFAKPIKLVRVMPNTAARVGEAVSGFCANANVTPEEKERAREVLSTFGEAVEVKEKDMEIVAAIGASAPAFVYMMIEALADGAVAEGLKRDLAYRFASQMVLGSGKMFKESDLHPGTLKDMVCSPAGTTIEGVSVLEERGFRSALMQAIRACVDKSRELADN